MSPFRKTIKTFNDDVSGAVTVDWVVLCGAVVSIAVGIVAIMQGGLVTMAGELREIYTEIGTDGGDEDQ